MFLFLERFSLYLILKMFETLATDGTRFSSLGFENEEIYSVSALGQKQNIFPHFPNKYFEKSLKLHW